MHHSSNNSIELSLLDVSDSLITTLVLNIANLRIALDFYDNKLNKLCSGMINAIDSANIDNNQLYSHILNLIFECNHFYSDTLEDALNQFKDIAKKILELD